MIGRKINVCSTKYDGSPHWEFEAFSVIEEGPLLIAQNFAGQQLRNPSGPWTTPYHVRNHFWLDGRWYNVMRFEDPRTAEYSWYCNVATPVMFDGETLRYADLDLDVRIRPSGEVEVLDEDEFLENSRSMAYPPEVIERSRAAVDEIIALYRAGEFPFPSLDARPPVR